MLEIPKEGKKSKAEKVLCLIRLLPEKTGNTQSHPPTPASSPHHEPSNSRLFSINFLHARCQDHELLCTQFRLLLLCFLSDSLGDRCIFYKEGCLYKQKQKRKDAFFCPKETALCPNLGKE